MIRFINPNYHVILIHYPLALLGLGLLIEIFGCLWPAGSLRSAGRWMLLLGALATIPAATSGLFAKYDIVRQLAGSEDGNWADIRSDANLTALQWQLLNRHVLLSSLGAVLATLAAIAWLGSSPHWPSRPAGPLLLAFVASMGLMTFGAYSAGEIVYRTQFATQSQGQSDKLQRDWNTQTRSAAGAEKWTRRIDYYIDPLQVHVILAGLVFSLAAGALGLSLKKSAQLRLPAAAPDAAPTVKSAGHGAGKVWSVTLLAAVAAGGIGWYVFARDLSVPLWHVRSIFDSEIWRPFHKDAHENGRTLAHLVLGGSIVLLALLLIPAARWGARSRLLMGLLGLVMLAAIAGQIGVGMLMLYDTDSGPLAHFNPPASASPN